MRCPKCKSNAVFTIDSRDHSLNRIKRRKKCECGYKWNTLEYVERIQRKPKVIRTCDYLGCNKPTFGKGNRTKYCAEHRTAWDKLEWEFRKARCLGRKMPTIPIQFNRKVRNAQGIA